MREDRLYILEYSLVLNIILEKDLEKIFFGSVIVFLDLTLLITLVDSKQDYNHFYTTKLLSKFFNIYFF